MDGLEAGGSDDDAVTAMDVGAEAASGELSGDDEDEVRFRACSGAFVDLVALLQQMLPRAHAVVASQGTSPSCVPLAYAMRACNCRRMHPISENFDPASPALSGRPRQRAGSGRAGNGCT
jgi:hypothetical protein